VIKLNKHLNKKMNYLCDWNLAMIFTRVRPSTLKKLINLGFSYIFDEYFFLKYFRIHRIPKTQQPDLPQLIGWELRQPQEIDLSKMPWNEESQSPQWITGDDNNGYTIYYDNLDQYEMIENDLMNIVRLSINSRNDNYNASTNGYYETLTLKNINEQSQETIKIVICIRYCPYDAITIGYYIPEYDLWEFDYSSINRLVTLLLTISALLYDPTLNGDLGQMCVVNRQAYDLYMTNPAQFRKQAKKLSGGIEQIKAKAYNRPQIVRDYIFRQDTEKQFQDLTQQQLRQLKQQKQRKAQQEQRRVHKIRDDLNDTLLAIRRPRGP
jgi:ferredoxin